MLAVFSLPELLKGFGILTLLAFVVALIAKHTRLSRPFFHFDLKKDYPSKLHVGLTVFNAASLAITMVALVLTLLNVTNWWLFFWEHNIAFVDLNRALFPDLNGEWEGGLLSNGPLHGGLPAQQQSTADCTRFGPVGPGFACRNVRVTISMTLFTTEVTLHLDNSVSYSKDVTLKRKEGQHNPQLMYLYEVYNRFGDAPEDDQRFNGAAILEVFVGSRMKLQGRYWTDRNWRAGKNTAGLVDLTRIRL